MSGGRIVVLDRLGREAKTFVLAEGSASIGGDPSCDIRVMLPGVRPHHATVQVHANRTLVRALDGETLLNGAPVSVAPLRHGDKLQLGGRALRWEYDHPPLPPPAAAAPCLAVPRRGAAARARRRSEPARRALHAPTRDSAPASTSVKQVAVVQPQRRDTCERNVEPLRSQPAGPPSGSSSAPPAFTRKSFPSKSPRPLPPDDPTKASLWIESRKPRASPPALVQTARNSPRNTAKSTGTDSPRLCRKRVSNISTRSLKNVSTVLRDVSPRETPGRGSPRESLRGSFRTAPLRLAVLKKAHSAQTRVTKIRAPLKIDHTKQAAIMLMTGHAARPRSVGPPARSSAPAGPLAWAPQRATPRRTGSYRANNIRESDKETPVAERRSGRQHLQSPALASPKKSSLKNPTANKSSRKTESIKFDLSNLGTLSSLETYDQNISSDVVFADSAEDENGVSDEDITLHYSDSSSTKSPSPTKRVHSRSSRIIEKSLGSPMQTHTFKKSTSPTQTHRSKRSLRGSIIVQKALNISDSRYSPRTTKSLSDQSYSTTITSRISAALSPRSVQNLEAYSIVDLVSIGSNESGRSIYNSVDSHSTTSFGTPGTIRKTRSKDPSLLGSSTPYLKKMLSPKHDSHETKNQSATKNSTITTRRSASITTPENTQNISLNSTRISRHSRSRSRINDSDILLFDEEENEESSPRSSRRISQNLLSPIVRKNITIAVSSSESLTNGTTTPENGYSPQDIGTPVLSIQNLLDRSSVSQTSKPRGRPSLKSRNTRRSNVTRRTIGSTFIEPKKSRISVKYRSLNLTGRRSLRARKTSLGSLNVKYQSQDIEVAVTPKSAVKLVQEPVKNKHSTAKKPLSKRSLIDNLDDSDFVKELFNSPVKRKLSQSMIEFSRKFFDDDEMMPSRSTRNTVALTGRTPENSLLNNTQTFTPEIFVSPLGTPTNSPNLTGLKRLFKKNTPDNDLRNVQGVKSLLRTPRARKSINNDLCNISGVKKIFGRSPRNRLSDVRVKEMFALSPTADYGRVSGVKALFQRSPSNDLRNHSGARRTSRVNTPKNSSDVRGAKQSDREQYTENDSSYVSGVEELPDESVEQNRGRKRQRSTRGARSLRDSIGLIADDIEEWPERQSMRGHRPLHGSTSTKGSNVTREPRKLHTDTVHGGAAGEPSRSAAEECGARKLPLKKRSVSSPAARRSLSLPLKKRAVPHSTPLRAARDPSMNASELARVSPIAADEHGMSPVPPESPRTRAAGGRRPKAAKSDPKNIDVVKPSPKRTRSKVSRVQEGRVTRGRKPTDNEAAPASEGRATVVVAVAEKPSTMKPMTSPKITRTKKESHFSNKVNSSKKIGSATQKPEITMTPKRTRSKVLKDTMVEPEPSPQVKPRSKRQIKEKIENIPMERPKRIKIAASRQNIDKGPKTKKVKEVAAIQQPKKMEPLKLKRGRKNASIEIEAINKKEVPVKKRGRKAQEVQNMGKTPNKRKRKIPDSKITKPIESQPNKTSRGKMENKVLPKSRQRKVAILEPSPVKVVKTRTVDKVIRKSRQGTDIKNNKDSSNTKNSVEKLEMKMKGSKKIVAESSAVEIKTSGRKTTKTIAKEEAKLPNHKKTESARALRKRPSLDPVEDTAVETKKRRTRRGVTQGTS